MDLCSPARPKPLPCKSNVGLCMIWNLALFVLDPTSSQLSKAKFWTFTAYQDADPLSSAQSTGRSLDPRPRVWVVRRREQEIHGLYPVLTARVVPGWPGVNIMWLSDCGSMYDCLSRSVSEIYLAFCWGVKQQTSNNPHLTPTPPPSPQEKDYSMTLYCLRQNSSIVNAACWMNTYSPPPTC